jgi:hypothetical protein
MRISARRIGKFSRIFWSALSRRSNHNPFRLIERDLVPAPVVEAVRPTAKPAERTIPGTGDSLADVQVSLVRFVNEESRSMPTPSARTSGVFHKVLAESPVGEYLSDGNELCPEGTGSRRLCGAMDDEDEFLPSGDGDESRYLTCDAPSLAGR